LRRLIVGVEKAAIRQYAGRFCRIAACWRGVIRQRLLRYAKHAQRASLAPGSPLAACACLAQIKLRFWRLQ